MAAVSLDNLDSYIFESTYPIGSVYFTTVNANPNTILRGAENSEWTQIKGKYIRALNDNESTTGGSDTITLTVANLPSHTHDAPQGDSSKNDYVFEVSRQNGLACTGRVQLATSTTSGYYANTTNKNAADSIGINDLQAGTMCKSTKPTGSGTAITNLPSYQGYYVWERTA